MSLTQKTLAFLKAVVSSYNARYIVKIDDDVYLRTDRLTHALLQYQEISAGEIWPQCKQVCQMASHSAGWKGLSGAGAALTRREDPEAEPCRSCALTLWLQSSGQSHASSQPCAGPRCCWLVDMTRVHGEWHARPPSPRP